MNTQTQTSAPFHNDAGPDHLKWRIRGEYLEMPGLRLSLDQATRLWALAAQRAVPCSTRWLEPTSFSAIVTGDTCAEAAATSGKTYSRSFGVKP